MLQTETTDFANEMPDPADVPAPPPSGESVLPAHEGTASCPNCQRSSTAASEEPGGHLYALGRIEMRFPSLGVEKELTQAVARTDTSGLSDQEAIDQVLSQRANRYLARRLCWVLTIEGLETYLVRPRDPADFEQLIAALRPAPSPLDLDVVIGARGPMAPPEMCGGLQVPIVMFEQIYSFDRDALVEALPRPKSTTAKNDQKFRAAASQMLDRILQLADNAGATDDHRALNYLAVRYPAIYTRAAEAYEEEYSLASVEVRPSRLSGARKIVQVIFSYTHRQTDVTEKFFVRVDVSEVFPFLVTKLSPFYDR